MTHLEKEHAVPCNAESKEFESEKQFLKWKEEEESSNYVYFSRQYGTSEGKETRYAYYMCQHDGNAAAHNKKCEPDRKTSRKNKKGVVKTGTVCPARMCVKTSLLTGMVTVNYIKSHSHEIPFKNTEHHPVPKNVKEDIKAKLSMQVPVNEVYRDLRDG